MWELSLMTVRGSPAVVVKCDGSGHKGSAPWWDDGRLTELPICLSSSWEGERGCPGWLWFCPSSSSQPLSVQLEPNHRADMHQSKIRSCQNWRDYIFSEYYSDDGPLSCYLVILSVACSYTCLWPGCYTVRQMGKNHSMYKELCSGWRQLVPDALKIIPIKLYTADDPTDLFFWKTCLH